MSSVEIFSTSPCVQGMYFNTLRHVPCPCGLCSVQFEGACHPIHNLFDGKYSFMGPFMQENKVGTVNVHIRDQGTYETKQNAKVHLRMKET